MEFFTIVFFKNGRAIDARTFEERDASIVTDWLGAGSVTERMDRYIAANAGAFDHYEIQREVIG